MLSTRRKLKSCLSMNKIDIVLFMTDSFTNDSFNKEFITYQNDSIIINFNFNKIWIAYKPLTLTNLNHSSVNFFRTKNENLNYYLSPLIFLIYNFTIFIYLARVCFKFRPRVLLAEGFVVALYAGILRKCGLCSKSIFLSQDWLQAYKNKSRLLAYIVNAFVFPYMDYLACKLNDIVLNTTDKIKEARYKYWNKKIAKKEKVFSYSLYPYRIATRQINFKEMNKKICFIGNMRNDCGLDIAIKALSELRKYKDFSLKVIGPYSLSYKNYVALAKECQVDQYVEFLGFVERDKFDEILSDCFCGLNIITTADSYTSYTFSAKSMDYLQYLLPSISSKNIGDIASIIQRHKLGIVIEPSEKEFIITILKIYQKQKEFRKNIINFINSAPKLNIKELIED